MARVKCPRCQNVVDYAPPNKPVCASCGYGANSPATPRAPPAQPAAAQASWNAPAPQASWGAPAASAAGYGGGSGYGAPGYGQPAYGYPPKRPGLATAAGIVQIVFGGLSLLGGFALLALAGIFGSIDEGEAVSDFLAMVFLILAIVVLIIGAVQLVAGIGLLKNQSWARILTIVLAILSLANAAFTIFQGDFTSILAIGAAIFLLVAMFNKDVAAFYASRSG